MTAQHTKHAKHTKRKRRRRRSPLRILIILILVIAVLVGLTLSTVHKKLGKISTKSLDHSQLVTVNKDSNMTDYTNYAFFGIDSQTGSMSDRGNRSDSIIVVSINNSTKDVKLLSIYRDTYVSINGKYSKINAAYSWGGPELAISTINRNLDLNIEKYATVNFKILADIVDAVGGIELKVDKSILKNLNAYIGDRIVSTVDILQNFLLPVLILWMEIKLLLIPESVIPLAVTLPEPEDNEKSFRRFLTKPRKIL